MQVTISLKKDVKAEVKQSLTKRCALPVCRTLRSIAHHSKSAPSMLVQSFVDVRDVWVSTRPNA